MRPEFLTRLTELIYQKMANSWKEGWVYGHLKQEFSLERDELEEMAHRLGFKHGWNPGLEDLLEHQWSKEKNSTQTLERIRKEEKQRQQTSAGIMSLFSTLDQLHISSNTCSDTEMALFMLISKLSSKQQESLLQELCLRFKSQLKQ